MSFLRWLFALHSDGAWPPADWPLWLTIVHLSGRGMIVFACLFLPLAFYLSARRSRPDLPRYQVWQALSVWLIGVGIVVGLTPAMDVWPAWRFLGLLSLVVGLVGVLWTVPATVRYVRWVCAWVPPEILEATEQRAERAEAELRVRLREEAKAKARVREAEQAVQVLVSQQARRSRNVLTKASEAIETWLVGRE